MGRMRMRGGFGFLVQYCLRHCPPVPLKQLRTLVMGIWQMLMVWRGLDGAGQALSWPGCQPRLTGAAPAW